MGNLKDIACVWNLVDMVEKVFTNANIVARMKFRIQFGTIDASMTNQYCSLFFILMVHSKHHLAMFYLF